MLESVVDFLEQTTIAPGVFRTALRLARRTEPGAGYVRVSYEEMLSIVGTTSENTMRGHLVALARTGVLTYKRNHSVHVMWADVICERSNRAVGDQFDRTAITMVDDVICERSNRAVGDHEMGENEKSDRTQIKTRGERSNRAVGDHPIGRIGRKVGSESSDPTYLPTGVQGGNSKNAPADDEERQRSFALLTDTEIGLDHGSAAELARRHRFESIRAMVFRFVRDRAAGTVRSAAIITTRFQKGYAPGPILDVDRETPLWRRHCDEADDLRSRYIPDEYASIIHG